MPLPSENVLETALQLPESERLALVDRLLEILPDDDLDYRRNDAPRC